VTLERVRRNIRLLRDQILPEGTRRGEAFPETLRLMPLFDMQDSLIEHKFPHEKAEIIDTIISNPGDIYREMTHAYPHYGYVGEKWERLTTWAVKPPLSWLQAGDWEEIKTQIQDPSYKALRDQYLSNLQRLREETTKMPMDPKRSAVMVESLDMIKALIFWFESLDPYTPPRQQLDRLTGAIANYFPREFFEGARVQILPSTDMLYRYAQHPSIASMYNITLAPTLQLKQKHGEEIRHMVQEAEKAGREIGAMLCQNPAGQFHLSQACYGRRQTVTVVDCRDGLSPVGSFHTHLGSTALFSPADLELALRKEQLSCLGYIKQGKPYLKCISPQKYHELPLETKVKIKRSIDQAKEDIDKATRLFQISPHHPEGVFLSKRAQEHLHSVETLLGSNEVEL